MGFRDMSKHIIVERDIKTYNKIINQIKQSVDPLIKQINIKTQVFNMTLIEAVDHLNGTIAHVDFDSVNSYSNPEIDATVRHLDAINIPSIWLTCTRRKTRQATVDLKSNQVDAFSTDRRGNIIFDEGKAVYNEFVRQGILTKKYMYKTKNYTGRSGMFMLILQRE